MTTDIKLEDLIYIEKILTDKECDALIKERIQRNKEASQEQCTHALTGVMTKSTFKQVELIPNTNNFDIVHKASEKIINNWLDYLEKFNSFSTLALKHKTRFSHKYRLMEYDVGGWIHPHIDWNHFTTGSLTLALNDESEYLGGDFKFFNRHTVRLKKGEAMVFPANPFFVHEVTEITKGKRYSVNSFLSSIPIKDYEYLEKDIHNVYWNDEWMKNPFFYNTSREVLKGL